MAFDWWTLTLQAVNVLILAWLLGHFFYRPVVAMVEKRRAEAEKLLADADGARAEAKKASADIAATRQGIAAEHDKIVAQARKEAETARAAALKDAQREVEKLRASSEADIERERADMQKLVMRGAGALAIDIAQRLLERLHANDAASAFVGRLCGQIQALPPQARATLAAGAKDGSGLEVFSAEPLSDEQKSLCAAALKDAVGGDVRLSYRTDPTLIAGIEIRGRDIALHDNWRDDLEHIRKELASDGGKSQST